VEGYLNLSAVGTQPIKSLQRCANRLGLQMLSVHIHK